MEAAEQTQRTRRWLTTLKFLESVIRGGEAIATSPPDPSPPMAARGDSVVSCQFSVFSFQFSDWCREIRGAGPEAGQC